MNLRKLFAVLAGVSIIAQPLTSVFGATAYGAELENAYAYAYSKGVTTQYPIDNANMYGALTRVEMSKMIANWAEEVLDVKADTSKSCTFTDLGGVKDTELLGTIQKACQMGLMGQWISQFRPFDVVSRAEFGTILSRAIWGDKNDGGVPYYAAHLNALKNAGIMTMINDAENTKEVRGYVMIMLERADENLDPSKDDDCKDPLVMLACALEADDCPAKCRGDVTDPEETRPEAKGDLDVSFDKSSSLKYIPAKGIAVLDALELESSEDITLYSIVLEKTGLTERTNVSVWFEKDGIRVSSKARINTDGTVTLNFNNGFKIKKSETVDLVVEVEKSAGSQISFKIADIDSSAKNISVKGKETSTYQTVKYDVTEVEFSGTSGSVVSYKLGERETFELGKFRLYLSGGDNRDVKIQTITLKNDGRADLANLTNVRVLKNGKVISKEFTINSRDLTIVLNDVIEAGKSPQYTIEAEVTAVERDGDDYKFSLNKTENLVAVEDSNNYRTTTSIRTGEEGMTSYAFQGGKMLFVNDSSLPTTIDVGSGFSNVVIASGSLNVTEPVVVKNFKIGSGTNLGKIARSVTLEIGGSRYTADPDANGEVFFEGDFYVNKSASVKLSIDVLSNPTAPTLSLANINAANFTAKGEYQNSGEEFENNAINGSIRVSKVNIKESRFSLTRTSNASKISLLVSDPVNFTLFEGKVSNSSLSDLTVNEFTVAASGLPVTGASVDLTLTIDGEVFDRTVSSTNYEITFNSLGIDLPKGKSVDVKIEGTAHIDAAATVNFSVKAQGEDEQGNEATTSSVSTSYLDVKTAGSVEITTSTAKSSLITQETSDVLLATSNITVKNGRTNIYGVEYSVAGNYNFAGSSFIDWSVYAKKGSTNIKLDGNYDYAAGKLTLSNVNEELEVGTYSLELRASFGSAPDTATDGEIEITDVALLNDTNTAGAAKTIDVDHMLVKAAPTVTIENTRGNGDVINVFGLKVTNTSKNDVMELSGAVIGLTGTVGGATNAIPVLVKDSNGLPVSDTNRVVINPGESYTLRVESSTPMVKDGSYTAEITDLFFGVDLTPYSGIGAYNVLPTTVSSWTI